VINGAVPLTVERDQLNLTDKNAVEEYFREHQPEAVILSAAKVGGIFANMSEQVAFLVENLQIQNSVILAARDSGIKKLVFLGSSCIYPKNAVQPIDEDSLLTGTLEQTNEAYALAKISGVKLCQYIREERGFDYFSLMPTNLYGPGDNFHLKNSHVPAAFIRKFHHDATNLICRHVIAANCLFCNAKLTEQTSRQNTFLTLSGHIRNICTFRKCTRSNSI
jgi:GDP-L-fucose synthase